jgi:hypothetical protein
MKIQLELRTDDMARLAASLSAIIEHSARAMEILERTSGINFRELSNEVAEETPNPGYPDTGKE